MTLRSMTGFGRSSGEFSGVDWAWEIRSVNGKGLDARFRIPPAFDRIEVPARKLVSKYFSRGNFQILFSCGKNESQTTPALNQQALDAALAAISEIESKYHSPPSSAAEIMRLRGVFDTQGRLFDREEQAEFDKIAIKGLEMALRVLEKNRSDEGKSLEAVLLRQVDAIQTLTSRATKDPSRTTKAISERLNTQLSNILESIDSFDKARLHQEVALMATKADIQEELDRLCAHVEAARQLIAAGSPVGRKLEFLAQEFNRECNTLCSKSNSVSVTEIGLELKVVIDQFREQILNIE